MKNCISGGKQFPVDIRHSSKHPSKKRIAKLMKKKREKANENRTIRIPNNM